MMWHILIDFLNESELGTPYSNVAAIFWYNFHLNLNSSSDGKKMLCNLLYFLYK